MAKRIAIVAVLIGALGAGARLADQTRPEVAMARAATALLKTLDAAQTARIRFAFDSEERFNWHFIPRVRKGLPLKEMTGPQRDAAFELLKTGLSAAGVSRAEAIRRLEPVLRAAENNNTRDPDLYFFTIFGNPGDATWAWRYEGHHAAQNWTIVTGKAVATSPAFFGANPAEVMDGPEKGTRALAPEADLAWALLDGLSDANRQKAVINATAPNDIITGNARKAAIQDNAGLAVSAMSTKERGLLLALIETHADNQQSALAGARLNAINAAGVDKIVFAWMGATKRAPGAGHYYRIQGPTFLIEYDNTQNNANHQHIVWRDFNGDFGDDVLARHYAGNDRD